MDESILKVMIEQTEDLPFTEEEIFKAVAENLDRIMTESDEACLLVTGPMALVLYWEGDKVVVERVMKADELKDNL